MSKEKRSNLAIWKIDRNNSAIGNHSPLDSILKIVSTYNNKENVRKDEELNPVLITTNQIEGKNIKIFHKKRKSIGWKGFIGALIEDNQDENIFINSNNDFLCFIYDDSDIFLITAGAGYHAIQAFIDDSFPLEVAKKIFTGNFNYSETRGLTGITYSKSENYRRSYTFSRQEAFGRIWKKLTGRIDKNVIEKSPELLLVIDPKKKINAEMKSSFTFRKSVSFSDVVKLINAIQTLPEISSERKLKFKFLDTLREIKDKTEKEELNNQLIEFFYNQLSADSNEIEGFDFCHPSEVLSFFTGCNYKILNNMISESDYPNSVKVMEYLKSNRIASLDNLTVFKEDFEKIKFSFQKEKGDRDFISTSLVKYFHGEIIFNDKTYFLIDGKWYQTIGTFLENLLEDFVSEVFQQTAIIVINSIPLLLWDKDEDNKYIEGKYNIRQSQQDDFYYGDKIFVTTGKGKIELFDLLYVTDDEIYIIQVKNGFGASVRDACSQIEIAAEIIEEDIKSGSNILKKYYIKWNEKEQNQSVNEKNFINFFNNKRIYVLACSTAAQVFNEEIFSNKILESKIAQYEILGLMRTFKASGYDFKIQHINKGSNE